MSICKNCGKEIHLTHVDIWIHSFTGIQNCGLYAKPTIEIDRRLDANKILAEMAAREKPKPVSKQAERDLDFEAWMGCVLLEGVDSDGQM